MFYESTETRFFSLSLSLSAYKLKMDELMENESYFLSMPSFEFDLSEISLPSPESPSKDVKESMSEPGNKRRFGELSESEQDDIVTKGQAKRTSYNTHWGISVFKGT